MLAAGLPNPPTGMFYLVDVDGAFIVDVSGFFILTN